MTYHNLEDYCTLPTSEDCRFPISPIERDAIREGTPLPQWDYGITELVSISKERSYQEVELPYQNIVEPIALGLALLIGVNYLWDRILPENH